MEAPTDASDRTVHAEDMYVEIVRYNRAGKWYIEPKHGNAGRQKVTLVLAAKRALVGLHMKGEIHFDLPGGQAFDAKVRALRG